MPPIESQAFQLLLQRLDHQDDMLAEINERAKATNGRVTKLEIWRAQQEAVKSSYKWVLPLVTGLFSGTGAAIVVAVLSLH
jgi:hypothetical protein